MGSNPILPFYKVISSAGRAFRLQRKSHWFDPNITYAPYEIWTRTAAVKERCPAIRLRELVTELKRTRTFNITIMSGTFYQLNYKLFLYLYANKK